MKEAICVIPRSTTTNNNVFEIRHTNSGKEKEYCYFRHVHCGETIWLLIKTYLEPNLIEVDLAHFIVCMEHDWLIKFLDRVIDNDDEWYKRIDDMKTKMKTKTLKRKD